MKVGDPPGTAIDDAKLEDTNNAESASKDLVAEAGESCPLPAPPPPPLQPPRLLSARSRAPPRRTDHTYRDYSSFPVGELPAGKRPSTNFPSKLHRILSSPNYSHIISWMPHGRAWKVHNRELFMSEVVPKYFVQGKYESFTRQLNGWGFKRLHQSGNDFNAYYHQCFLRDLPHLVALMRRAEPNLGKLLPHMEGEPNFYEIEKQFPLALPTVPYQGHYDYSSSHMASAGYRAALPEVPEPPYHNRHHYYAPYPSSYPPPPPYFAGHYGGPPPAAVNYAPPPHPEYSPSYPYYPPARSSGQLPAHDHYHRQHYPYPPGAPLGDAQPYRENTLSNNAADVERGEEVQQVPPTPANQEHCPMENERTSRSHEPLNISRELHSDSFSWDELPLPRP